MFWDIVDEHTLWQQCFPADDPGLWLARGSQRLCRRSRRVCWLTLSLVHSRGAIDEMEVLVQESSIYCTVPEVWKGFLAHQVGDNSRDLKPVHVFGFRPQSSFDGLSTGDHSALTASDATWTMPFERDLGDLLTIACDIGQDLCMDVSTHGRCGLLHVQLEFELVRDCSLFEVGSPFWKPKDYDDEVEPLAQQQEISMTSQVRGVPSLDFVHDLPPSSVATQTCQRHCAGLSDFLRQVEESLHCFFRSLALLYFLSCLHVCCRAAPLRAGRTIRNAGIRRARAFARGAPLILACFWAHVLPVQVQGVGHSAVAGLGSGVSPVGPSESQADGVSCAGFPVEERQPVHSRTPQVHFSTEEMGGQEPTNAIGCTDECDLHLEGPIPASPPLSVHVVVCRFQRSPISCVHSVSGDTDAQTFLESVRQHSGSLGIGKDILCV